MRHYDTVTKPALNKLARTPRDNPRALKRAIDAARAARATPHEIIEHVGGVDNWNEIVRSFRAAGLI